MVMNRAGCIGQFPPERSGRGRGPAEFDGRRTGFDGRRDAAARQRRRRRRRRRRNRIVGRLTR